MAKRKKGLAGNSKKNVKIKSTNEKSLIFIELVETIRRGKNKAQTEEAFNKIVQMLDVNIRNISYRFRIPGHDNNDVYQEALFALRYKAIKDYNKERSALQTISPFDKFAMLCIRRHLSTKLKSSHQNKSRVLNTSISLDQDRGDSDSSNDAVFLIDILPKTDGDILSQIHNHSHAKYLFNKLWEKLSPLEKNVLLFYHQGLSYQKISKSVNKNEKNKNNTDIKSIDNALSRLKVKAKAIYKKYGK